MAIKTYAEQLEDVQTAIAQIEGGAQSYSIRSRSYTYADLGALYKRERWLRKMATTEDARGDNNQIRTQYGNFYR